MASIAWDQQLLLYIDKTLQENKDTQRYDAAASGVEALGNESTSGTGILDKSGRV
jgi:hypothetical protein